MYSIRFFTLAFILTLPFFSFAQTPQPQLTPTELERLMQQLSDLSNQTLETPNLDVQRKIVDDAIKNLPPEFLPTTESIRANAISEYLDLKTSPSNPGPREMVQVTIESYLSDLSKATISWSVNDKQTKRGIGEKSFSFQNGSSGETTRLKVSILTNEGSLVERELMFIPVGVTILWEADTYTPPFYKGKALMAPQARVRVVAIPDVANARNALNAGNLVYVWKKDGSAVSEASGYGKNSFSFSGPKPYGNTRVGVQVSSLDDTINSEMRIDLPLTNPFILFYEDHPLLGTWYNRSLIADLSLRKKEFSVKAEPFFFSNEVGDALTLVYNWSLNGERVTNPGRTITLRNEAGEKGDSSLTLSMYGIKQTFQSAGRSLTINFAIDESTRPPF